MTGSALSQFLLHIVKSADNAYVHYFGKCMGVREEEKRKPYLYYFIIK